MREPLWTPGAAHGEHAFTSGHLIGELVRRITGQAIGSHIRSEFSEAHDIDVHIGLGSGELGRVTDIATDPDFWSSIGWTSREALAALGPDPGIDADVMNSAPWRTGEVPAVNGHASARGLARFWSLWPDRWPHPERSPRVSGVTECALRSIIAGLPEAPRGAGERFVERGRSAEER